MIKLVFLINRVEGMPVEAFVAHHRERHAPLFLSIPEAARHVRRYTVSHPVPAPGSYPGPAYDGLTEIWFEDWAGHDAFFTSRNYLDLVRPDEGTFIDSASVAVMVTEEKVVTG
ncbi:EthD domain-containing protein [Streptomyces sp. SID11385]|uniref:EthD domain-containing protein n=1 Tax=Streptomyces sp. SID11385 TaxID=2706031 RepID=UPI0013CC6B48|nr:EthD domain-containing protein [Streptomyces sp. SID11385]NEA40079.1 EthD domain-containing protein [Streptomyces sp. SID11385]